MPGFDRAGRPAAGLVTADETLIQGLHDTARFAEAWGLVGVDMPEQHLRVNWRMALGFWYRLPQVAGAVRHIGAESGSDRVEAGYEGRPYLVFEQVAAERMRMTFKSPLYKTGNPYVPLDRLGVPLDALLLYLRHLPPDDLHPPGPRRTLPRGDGAADRSTTARRTQLRRRCA
ncbi:hypothetical protein GCM10022255_088640 [Dactylosporangium darangshiense]|uniref:Uncharacterized protein n=1 Tax=Dactylosporangium darangshiense TaxID=579108 RepID=A0ABP8DNJ5_9ACTN